jgi:hypothetical protein
MQARASTDVLNGLCGLLAVLTTASAISPAAAQSAAPALLQAPAGITAIAGRIADANGVGLAGVRVADNAASTATDALGRFLLAPVVVGKSVVQIDGRKVGRVPVDYGFYEVQALAESGRTTPLGFTSYLTPLDHTHDVTIASPTVGETVVRTPAIANLELHIAAGTVVHDAQGHVVTQIGITKVPANRQPFPGPKDPNQRVAFTIQPGAACLDTAAGGIGYAWIVYPNYHNQLPRAREGLERYEPDQHGWRVYGAGSVSADGRQVIPDRNAVITDFGSAECDPKTRSSPLIIPVPAKFPTFVPTIAGKLPQ